MLLCATGHFPLRAPLLFKTTEGFKSQKNNWTDTSTETSFTWPMLTHWSAFIYNHLMSSLVLFLLDMIGWIGGLNTKLKSAISCKIQVSTQQCRLELCGRKNWTRSLLMSSLLSVKVSSWLCVWISGLQSRKWRNWEQLSTQSEPRGLQFHRDGFSWVLSLESGNWLGFQMRTVGN